MNLLTKPSLNQLAAKQDAEHTKLEQWFEALSQCAKTVGCRACDDVWNDFTQQVEKHMAFEEREVFPRYARCGATEEETVKVLLAEHAAVRKQLEEIGVDLQLHLGNPEVLDGLFTQLREHARRERETLYPWLAAQNEATAAQTRADAAY